MTSSNLITSQRLYFQLLIPEFGVKFPIHEFLRIYSNHSTKYSGEVKTIIHRLYEMSQIGRSIEIENRSVVFRRKRRQNWGITANKYGFSSRGSDESFLKLNNGDNCTTLIILKG